MRAFAAIALLALAACQAGQSTNDLITPDQLHVFIGDEDRDGQFGRGVPYESDGDMVSVGLSWDLTVDRTLSRSLDRLVHELAAARCESHQPKPSCPIETEHEPEQPARCESTVEPTCDEPPPVASPCQPEEPVSPLPDEEPRAVWLSVLFAFGIIALVALGCLVARSRPSTKRRQ